MTITQQIISIIRSIASLPALILGIVFFRIAEIVSNDKYTYRSDDVKQAVLKNFVNAKCTNCGHVGKPEFLKNK